MEHPSWPKQERLYKGFVRAGMFVDVQIVYAGTSQIVNIKGDYRIESDIVAGGRSSSNQHMLTYRHSDAKPLAEGDQVRIAGEVYRVRETPLPESSFGGFPGDGYWYTALLTKNC